MSCCGRARLAIAIAFLNTYISITETKDYGVPIEIKLWDTGRTPLAHMVDVTNGFGLKVLAEHNFLNDNNIAFSPYGLMGIMVALYEGIDGESSYQMQRGMQLPWNRNVMRIGFRDIHRTLKTYFVPEEGFLAGLALNNENVTFNDSYKKILRFYGFDLDDRLPTLSPTNGTSNATTGPTTTASSVAETTTAMSGPTNTDTSTMPTREETTLNPNAETIDVRGPMEPTTAIPSSAPNAEETKTTAPTSIVSESSSVSTETTASQTTQSSAIAQSSTSGQPSTPDQSSTQAQTSTSGQSSTQAQTTTPDQPSTQTQTTTPIQPSTPAQLSTPPQPSTQAQTSTPDQPSTQAQTSTPDQPSTQVQTSTPDQPPTQAQTSTPDQPSTQAQTSTPDQPSTQVQPSTQAQTSTPDQPSTQAQTSTPDQPSTPGQPSTQDVTTQTITMMQSMETDAESISQQTSQATSALPDDTTTNEVASTIVNMRPATSGVTNSEPSTMSMSDTTSGTTPASSTTKEMTTEPPTTVTESLETLQRRKKSIVDFIFTNPPYVDDYFFYRSYHVGPEMPMPTPAYDDKMFLANGLKSIQVTYMNYETVLEHAYLPHLEASALRLPLDSERYYLLVVLPDRRGVSEIGRLLGRMARESDLADVYAALRPRRVRAIVPSFIVKGHVTLTTDLQKLGIRDVFEPRQRDFTPMTRQGGVYVRSIEQAVSVAIRKYKPDDPKKNRYVVNRDLVKFYATYPFLYFVMDASIHVALMAGKMVDPLNSRIL